MNYKLDKFYYKFLGQLKFILEIKRYNEFKC